jgi:hypothetical protein
MKKLLSLILMMLSVIVIVGCSSTVGLNNAVKQADTPKKELIGGWYPIFFHKYDQIKVDSIIKTVAEGKAEKVTISYSKNKKLAKKILAGIQSKLNFAVNMEHLELKDGTAKYDHEQVTVIIDER